jgi:hypothetical protein
MVTIAMYPLWEGLDEQQWTNSHLQKFQNELREFDFLKSHQLGMRGERTFAKMITDMIRTNRSELTNIFGIPSSSTIKGYAEGKMFSIAYHSVPDGWFYQNQLTISQLYEMLLTSVDPEAQRVFKQNLQKTESAVGELRQGFLPYKMVAGILFPAVMRFTIKCSFEQTAVNEAVVACALERYRLANGTFPENLATLSPQFLDKIPHDIINGEPLKYRRTDDEKFILYSVGWNETDDGGTVALTSTGRSSRIEEGDWVWQYSTNAPVIHSTEPEGVLLR